MQSPLSTKKWVAESLPVLPDSMTCELVSDHSWAQTYRITSGPNRYWLKVLPEETNVSLEALSLISKSFPDHVPELIRFDPANRQLLFADHGGSEPRHSMTHEQSAQILRTYANLQGSSMHRHDLLSRLPKESPIQYLERFMFLLNRADEKKNGPDTSHVDHPGNPFALYEPADLEFLKEFFEAAYPLLRTFIERAEQLTKTLNHGDLRGANTAFRKDGKVCLFDWDEAVVGPVGLSLHAQFDGCYPVYLALQPDAEAETDEEKQRQALLKAYIDTLVADHGFDRGQLEQSLPSSVCAGVLRYICSFSPYAIEDAETKAAISGNVWRRLEDLMNLAQSLAVEAGEDAALEIAYILHSHQYSERAFEVYENAGVKPRLPKQILDVITTATPPEVFPTLRIPSEERETRKLSHLSRNTAVEMFKKFGALLIEDAIPTSLVEACHREFFERKQAHDQAITQNKALQVGDQRFMITVDFQGAFAEPDVYASPLVLPILRKLLSEDAILGSYTAVASMPGAAEQKLHRDNPALFVERPDMILPHFSIAMIIPLVRLNQETGATRIMKSSHRPGYDEENYQEPEVELGSCYLMDARLYHQGMANRSQNARPILSLVFQRPWYHDPVNFRKQTPLSISREVAARVPEQHVRLLDWAFPS